MAATWSHSSVAVLGCASCAPPSSSVARSRASCSGPQFLTRRTSTRAAETLHPSMPSWQHGMRLGGVGEALPRTPHRQSRCNAGLRSNACAPEDKARLPHNLGSTLLDASRPTSGGGEAQASARHRWRPTWQSDRGPSHTSRSATGERLASSHSLLAYATRRWATLTPIAGKSLGCSRSPKQRLPSSRGGARPACLQYHTKTGRPL